MDPFLNASDLRRCCGLALLLAGCGTSTARSGDPTDQSGSGGLAAASGGRNSGGNTGLSGGTSGIAGSSGQTAGGAETAAKGGDSSSGSGGSDAGNGGGPNAGNGGSFGGTAAQGGSAGTGGAATTFACNEVVGMTLAREWFQAGFESDAGISDGRWELKAREHGYITEWANAESDFWNEPVQSPCTTNPDNPDHVVLVVLSWNPACCTTQAEWQAQIDPAISNLKAKYSKLQRIDLMTVIRGPNNQLCPMPPAANETISMPKELDGALAATAGKNPGFVHVAPAFEAPDCASFMGGGPHLTTAGNMAVAKVIAAYFSAL